MKQPSVNAWSDAIDREYNALLKRETWLYVKQAKDMNVLVATWIFRIKPFDCHGKQALYKARCRVRGDQQIKIRDYDPSRTCTPVASHEAI